jgi:hypothetical protein
MLKAHHHWPALTVLVLLTGGARAVPEDTAPQPGPAERLGRILDEWQARSASYSTLDLRFTSQTLGSLAGQSPRPSIGRVILQPGRAVISTVSQPDDTMDGRTVRFIWVEGEVHEIRPESKEHIIYPIAPGDRDRLPAALALPFLWNTSEELLKQRYRVELLKEEGTTCLLGITPLTERGLRSFSRATLQLDLTTYLPRRYVLADPAGRGSTEYRLTEPRINQPIPEGAFGLPEGDGWKLTRVGQGGFSAWLLKSLKPDLLP